MPDATPVAAYEATLEDRILLSAVSTALGGQDGSAENDAATESDAHQVSDQPEGQSDSMQGSLGQHSSGQDGLEGTADFILADSFPLLSEGKPQTTQSETSNGYVTAGAVGESESSGQQLSSPPSSNSNSDLNSLNSDSENSGAGDSAGGLTSLPDSIQSIVDSKLTSNPVPDSDAESESPSEATQHDTTDKLEDGLAVLVKGAQSENSLPSVSSTSQHPADDPSQAAEWRADSSKQQVGSSIVQRPASFGRAYAIVPKQHVRIAAVSETANASFGSSVRSQSAQADDGAQVWRPVSALLGGVERAESTSESSAVVRVTNWMTGQTGKRHRLTLAESTVTLATEREFAEAGEGRSQGPSHDSQTHILIRLETEVTGLTTDVDADDNPPERPDILGVWQHLKFDCNPRGPPGDDRIPISGFTRRTGSGDQLHQLRFSIAPRGPSVAFRS